MNVMRTRETNMTTGGLSGQQWSEIVHDTPRAGQLEADVLVPLLQATSTALAVGLAMGTAMALLGLPGALGIGALVFTVGEAALLPAAYHWTRETQWETERAVGASQHGASAQSEGTRDELTLYVQSEGAGGFVQTAIHKLATNAQTLSQIAQMDDLTVRALQDNAGVTQTESQRLLGELIAAGLLARDANNKPATWTASGRALRRQLTVERT